MNYIYQLCEGDITKVTSVLNSTLADSFMFRKMNLHISVFNDRFSEYLKNKK